MASVSPSPRRTRKERLASPPPLPSALNEDRRRRHSPGGDPSWLVDDLDHFAQTLTGIKAKGVRPELLGSILSHYASRWLPELSGRASSASDPSPESPTAAWLKKRFYVETLASVIPAEKGSLPCDFLLRLLRSASMVGAEPACLRQLEARVAAQLDEASLKELMIPAFSHTCGTLLDVGLVLRLVRRFADDDGGARSVTAVPRVAKLVDSYLAEAALDVGFTVAEFVELASALPSHVRAMDDGLYRAIDTYIKAHPGVSKQERKTLCRLIDARKLSSEAAHHAAQNERLPVRSVIQVLFSEHAKLNRLASADWSGSLLGGGGPNLLLDTTGARCPSKREVLLAQQQEVRHLRDDVSSLQLQCHALQAQLDCLGGGARVAASEIKKRRPGLLRWSASFLFRSGARATSDTAEKVAAESEDMSTEEAVQAAVRKQGRRLAKTMSTSTRPECRNSLS